MPQPPWRTTLPLVVAMGAKELFQIILGAGQISYLIVVKQARPVAACDFAKVGEHGGEGCRTWGKLHLAVDPDTGEIVASELTSTEDGDASQVGPLLDQISGPITRYRCLGMR